MSWVDVPEGFDVPAGQAVRLIARVEISPYLQWVPQQIINYILSTVAGVWVTIQALASPKGLSLERYEVVGPENSVYRITFYGKSKGITGLELAAILAVMITVLAILAIIGILYPEKVQRFAEAVQPVLGGAGGLLILLIIALALWRR